MSGTRRVTVILLSLVLAAAVACKRGGSSAPSGFTGIVTGQVFAADGKTPIVGARVTPKDLASPVASSDLNGVYTLPGVPIGTQQVRVKKGIFETSFEIGIKENETVVAPNAVLEATGKLAYVKGSYDSIETIIKQQLSNPVEEISASQLGDAKILANYRMIFLNCGLDEGPAANGSTISTLKKWVEDGGTLYASDWALTYVKNMLPNDILEFDQDTIPETVLSNVSDTGLRIFLGKTTASIRYDLGVWKALKTVSSRARPLLRGNYRNAGVVVQDKPLAIAISQGAGTVIFTTFHNEAGATEDQVAVLKYYVYVD